jgi:hypothetical protein
VPLSPRSATRILLFVFATLLALAAPAARASADDLIYTTTDNGTAMATIDPATGTGTVLGPLGHSNAFAAAIDTDGTLWTIVDGYTTARIATVNKTTGQATPAPSQIGTAMITLEIAGDGTMYGIGYSDQRLYRIDKTTGVGTPVGPATGISVTMDTAFDCDGRLWATVNGDLWTVDTTTGVATAKPSITGISGGASMVMGLMVDSSCRMLATTFANPGELYALNTTTGAATLVGSTGLNLPHGGSIRTFVPDTDAPSTTDDVPASFGNTAPTVTLNASDGAGSGVARIYCEIGVDPQAPTTSSHVYDPSNKPKLAHGEKIRYFAVDQRGNAEPEHTSAAAKVDTLAPATADDVPAAAQQTPVTVTLSAADGPTTPGDFAGVAAIHYEIGANPATPTTASPRYDAAKKPVLQNGEKIRYFAVDAAGNAEAVKTSRSAQVTAVVVTKVSQRKLTINLRARYNGRAVRAVHATIDGRKAKTARTRRGHTLLVDMRGHDCTPVKVQIKVALKGARAFTIKRTFKTCTPGR